MRIRVYVLACCLLLVLPVVISAQTPDGETPALEPVCNDLLGGTPGLYGLCVAFCEAQDLDRLDLTDPLAAKQIPRKRILEKYRGKMKPGDPDMPCVQVGCPCWTQEELDTTFVGPRVGCFLIDEAHSWSFNGTILAYDSVWGDPAAFSGEFYTGAFFSCQWYDLENGIVRIEEITAEENSVCLASLEQKRIELGLSCGYP